MEKWTSPHLTDISREYCKSEYVLDTGDLIRNMENLNESKSLQNENVHLFTLNVKALYPSIKPELTLQAIREVLAIDRTTKRNIKTAVAQFNELSFENSYVVYKDECYKSKVGIPTGGSLSRQIADIFLHWDLIQEEEPNIECDTSDSFLETFHWWLCWSMEGNEAFIL